MLNPIITQIKHNYKWSDEYAKIVAFEYDRFMKLRSANENLSPSDDIDKFWHQHILNTKHYNNYCFTKFNKFIHHDPIDSIDQLAREKRLLNTKQAYINSFGPIVNNRVWGIMPLKHDIPTVNSSNISIIKVELMYTFDVYDEKRNFITKKWKPNNKLYDKKIIPISFDNSKPFTIMDLKNFLHKKTNHFWYAIKIYKHIPNKPFNYSYYEKFDDKKYLQDETKISDLIANGNTYFMAVLDEDTSNGFC